MPYLYLAESLCELDHLTQLVHELEINHSSDFRLMDDYFLYSEINRIRKQAIRDILIFGDHHTEYLRNNMMKIYGLLIRVNQLIKSFPEISMMSGEEVETYLFCSRLKGEIENLALFFTDLEVC